MIHISTPSNRFPEERGSVTVTLPTEPAPVRFVALDVETATRAGEICQVGLAVFADGQLTASMNTLVRPRRNVFDPWCSMVHGITAADTKKAPTFAEIWAELKLYLEDSVVVCHNAPFDLRALDYNMDQYSLGDLTILDSIDTCRELGGVSLYSACRHFGVELGCHHDAYADAVAAGGLLLAYSQRPGETVTIARVKEPSRTSISAENRRPGEDARTDTPLSGKTVVISGVFSRFPFRDDLAAKLSSYGAKVTSSVSARTDFLIAGDGAGPSKLEKAAGLSVRVLSETDLYKMLDEIG